MPRAKEKSSGGLSIELSHNHKYYVPGSPVAGSVTLNTTEDFAIGSVSIEFYGRVKVFFVYSHGEGETVCRGRAPLFSQRQLLYEGYHTHKPGSFSWPFVVEVPTNPDPEVVQQAKHQWNEREHFLSTADNITDHPLPPTFRLRKWGFGYRYHAFVEYVIRVDVKEAQGASMILPPSSRTAVLPVMVRETAGIPSNTFTLPLSARFTLPEQLVEKNGTGKPEHGHVSLQSQIHRHTIRSSRLQNWNRERGVFNRSLSSAFKDKTRSMLNPASLPRYTFDITVAIPGNIRVLDADSIPFVVNATAVNDSDLTTIDNYPDIRIEKMSLSIRASTYIRFKSMIFKNTKTRYDIKLLDNQPVNYTIDMSRQSERTQLHFNNSGGDNETTRSGVDLLSLPGMKVCLVSAKMGFGVEKPLAQTFNTYIIAREYTLQWKLELEVAGEKVRLTSNDKIYVKVLPPSEEKLKAILQDSDADKAEADDDEGEESEKESVAVGEEKKTVKVTLRRLRSRRTKQEEAAEERAAAAESSTAQHEVLQYQPGEILPSYEQAPADFGYRHEIDEQSPRYEAR